MTHDMFLLVNELITVIIVLAAVSYFKTYQCKELLVGNALKLGLVRF